MGKLKSYGGFDDELLAKVKEELSGNLEFSEQQEPLDRNKAGMPSTAGFIDTHFKFGEGTAPFEYATCQRADGSYYGTGGTCRKGSEVKGGKPKDEKKSSSKSGGGGGSSSKPKKKKVNWDDFNKRSRAIEAELRKKYAGKTPKGQGGMTEEGMRAASGRLD